MPLAQLRGRHGFSLAPLGHRGAAHPKLRQLALSRALRIHYLIPNKKQTNVCYLVDSLRTKLGDPKLYCLHSKYGASMDYNKNNKNRYKSVLSKYFPQSWETWIRTMITASRARRPTIRRSPNSGENLK